MPKWQWCCETEKKQIGTEVQTISVQYCSKFLFGSSSKFSAVIFVVFSQEITCNFCKSKNKFSIRFDNKEKSLAKSKDPPTIELSALNLVNDKKRKLDQEPKTGMTKNANRDSSTSTASTKPKVQSIKVVHTKVKTNQKAKNFTNESKKTKNVTPAQKQRKGMLLLASVLKMNDHKQQNDSQLKLNKMFK